MWSDVAEASLPMLLGLAVAVYLTGLGVSAVSSSRIVIPVPQAGDNPFKSAPGAGFSTMLSGFATWGVTVALCLPAIVLAILSVVFDSVLYGWLTLAAGAVVGTIALVIGLRMGAAQLDRRGPDLLMRLKRMRSA